MDWKKSLKVLLPGVLALCFCASHVFAATSEEPASFDKAKVARFGFGNILMGGWTPQDGWVTAEALQGTERFRPLRIWGGEECRMYGSGGLKSEGVVAAMRGDHPDKNGLAPGSEFFFDTQIPGEVIKAPSGFLSIACAWEVQPRRPVALSLNSAVYRNIVKKYLATRGLTVGKPELVQLFEIDLEGDGVDEVLICAQNIVTSAEKVTFAADTPLITGTVIPGRAEKGAYSVVILRKLVDGKVLELPLHEYLSLNGSTPEHENWQPPVIGKVHQFADLNGDGVLEIIAGTAFYEGYSYHAFGVKGGNVREVLSCGAGN